MRVNTAVIGQETRAGNGGGQARVAGWSVPGYTGLKALGSGGFGDVVLARHDESGTLVAIKYLRQNLLSDTRFAEMFRGEAAVLASMDDPHVVRLYEYIESPSGAAIVMELVEGVSLRQILARQGGTTPEAALVVLQGSLLGLAAAHARGVVHRDYKPDNVLVEQDGASKLTDFGIAARAGDRAAGGGTLAYAPPEQFAGGPASPAGDVYAATATFFECLTGRPPFRGDSAAELLYQHVSQPVPVDAVPEPVRPLVAAGMAKQPEDRPTDAATFIAALNEVAAGAYGPEWHERGRSHLGEAALLLAALWPSGGPPAVQGTTVQHISLRQRIRRFRHRHSRAVNAAIVAAIVVAIAGTVLGIRLTGSGPSRPVTLPAVTGVSPASGSTVGGSTVTITGSGLADATVVRFGGVDGTITSDSGTQITVTSPPSTGTAAIIVTSAAITADSGTQITGTDTVDITVTTRFGTSKPAAADHYTYTAPQPAVTGVSPDGGSAAGGSTVTITGTGLTDATGVRFGGAAAAINADSSTQITVTSPPGTGTVTLTVTTSAGTSKTTAVGHYTYTTRPKPTQSISFTAPASGTAGGSAALSATGGGSGIPVVFSVDPSSGPGVCAVSGNTVTYTAAGSCVIDANQAGAGRYADAPQVQRTIMVNAIPQSISFTAPASGTVRGSAALSATGGGSGNPVVFSVDSTSGVCAVSGNTVTYTAAGSCVIDANQAGNGRYADAPQIQRTITVVLLPGPVTPTKTRPAGSHQLFSPFTGEPVSSLGQVLAVKIDNLASARPQTGLKDADIVYVIPVEGGLSRLLAVFSSHFPAVIGPVRSAREDDLELLRQFGRPAFAYSGAQTQLLPVVEQARIVDLFDGSVGGYFRDPRRDAPHNLYAHTPQLLAEASGASKAHDIGFRFGPAPSGGRPMASFSVSYPAASFMFRWSANAGRWLVWMDGAPARAAEDGQLNAPTVVIQYTKVRTSPFLKAGAQPPYAESTGTGTGWVLRGGQAYAMRWSRPNADGGTTFSTLSGQPMTFARGPVWVVLTTAP
jgi:eukaryotic-like serine/threonine-protein kinase